MRLFDFLRKKPSNHLHELHRVSLGCLPARQEFFENKQSIAITTGDGHGNLVLEITRLVHAGVLELLTQDSYMQFFNVENAESPAMGSQQRLALIDQLTVSKKRNVLIRKLGDLLGDRWRGNDILMLALLNKIPNKEIILSNHDAFFIRLYENYLLTQDVDGLKAWLHEFRKKSQEFQAQHRSATILAESFIANDITLEQVTQFMEGDSGYKKALKVLSYDLDTENNHIYIYAHTAIDFLVIKSYAEFFAVDYDDSSIEQLAKTIDCINEKFQQLYVQQNQIALLDEYPHQTGDFYEKYPVSSSIWGRPTNVVENEEDVAWEEDKNTGRCRTQLCCPKKSYGYTFVHGHVGPDSSLNNLHYVNLDTDAGKGDSYMSGDLRYFEASHALPALALLSRQSSAPPSPGLTPTTKSTMISPRQCFWSSSEDANGPDPFHQTLDRLYGAPGARDIDNTPAAPRCAMK